MTGEHSNHFRTPLPIPNSSQMHTTTMILAGDIQMVVAMMVREALEDREVLVVVVTMRTGLTTIIGKPVRGARI